jgi:hypothetical protein
MRELARPRAETREWGLHTAECCELALHCTGTGRAHTWVSPWYTLY